MYQLFIFGFSLIQVLLVIWNEPTLRGATSSDFLVSFFLLLCFFLSVSPVAEPKITEERRLTVITPSLPLESGTAGSLVPPFQEPPAHFFPSVIHEWRAHTFKLGFYLPVRLVISKKLPSKWGWRVRCQALLWGQFWISGKLRSLEQFNMIRLRIMQTGYTTEIWSVTSLNYCGALFAASHRLTQDQDFAITDARFVHNQTNK